MQFPQDFPDKLRSSILVSEVVGKKVVLKKKGREFMGLCPFHNEKTPSFTVNDQKGFYHCFGCQAHGDIITFEMNQEGLDFKEAIYKLARDFSIEVPQVKNFKIDQVNNDHLAYEILEEITKFFEKNLYLPIAQEARKYLQKRGINSVIAKKFRLGFALDSYESLTKHLQSKNYLEKDILQCGIIAKNDRQKIYDKLRNRITFPITNKKNQVIAYGARTLGNDLPKYLNSQETEIFKKNHTLYNIANARKAIFDKSFGVIVEGYMDAISLSANGIENVVAGLGTAIGENHLKQLFQITDKIIICLDGDSAGIRAARRLSDIALPLINVKKNIALAILPNELDPDDFIKTYGAQAFIKFLDEAKSLSQSLFDFAISDLSLSDVNQIVAEDRVKLEEILHQKTSLIIDNQCKKHFTNFFKDCVFNLTRNNFKKNIKTNSIVLNKTKFNNLGTINSLPKQAENIALQIISLLITYPTLCSYSDDVFIFRDVNLFDEKFTTLKEFLIDLIDHQEKNLLEMLENSEFNSYNKALKPMISGLSQKNFDSCKNLFRILLLKDLLLQLEIQCQESLNKNDDLYSEKITEILNYKNSIKLLINKLEVE